MRPGQARFVTACQQLLALGAVLAVLTPAASVISLDVVGRSPVDSPLTTGTTRPGLQAYRASAPAKVPATVVDPVVREIPLTAPAGHKAMAGTLQARVRPGPRKGTTEIRSLPQQVWGYGAVGVTWAAGKTYSEDQLSFQVRSRTGTIWSSWTKLVYDPDHGPDPTSAEAAHARPGTDPLLVGTVDQVQVRAESNGAGVPADMKFAVIDPGASPATRTERPAIDTATLDTASDTTQGTPADTSEKQTSDGAIQLSATTFTPKPQIFSRAQWGADESMREKSALHYYEVHAGFVHHTVNANDYTRAEVPALIRGIYAYHTRSRGWSDIGYNFLVDRFGRIWEGRYGGVDRPVVGAHTLGYNDYAFAMSAIGNYETAYPSDAVLKAYGALFAWKLSLHGVDAGSTQQLVGHTMFQAINGHRDAAATACPGRHLYARLATIRSYAAADQLSWSGRERQNDLAGTAHPDLIVRRTSDGQAFVIPTEGLTRFSRGTAASTGWTSSDTIVATPDVTGDGQGDVVVRGSDAILRVYPGDGAGGFTAPIKPSTDFRTHDQIAAAGDLDEDGHNDLVARNPRTGRLNVYLGGGRGGFERRSVSSGWGGYRIISGAGDVDADGHVDLVASDAAGTLWLRRGTGAAGFRAPVEIPGSYARYSSLSGLGDFSGDGRDDLFARDAATGAGYVLPSRGDGTYGHAEGPITSVTKVVAPTGANLTGSAAPDLVGRRGDSLVVLTHAGTYNLGTPIRTGMSLVKANLILNVGDWDRDGHGDIVTRSAVNGALYLHRGDGAGLFGKAVRVGVGFSGVRLLAAVGDMTGDGLPDLMGQPVGKSMRIYPGAGLNGLRTSYPAYGNISANQQIGVGRWNGDGSPDSLLRDGASLKLYPGNGPGGLTSRTSALGVDLSRYDWVVGIGDETLGGHPDLVARERATGYLWLLPGRSTGIGSRRFLGEGLAAYDLVG